MDEYRRMDVKPLESDAAQVTFNVARDGKSMTCLGIQDGAPVTTTYYSAGENGDP
jgi:hypothetical protein